MSVCKSGGGQMMGYPAGSQPMRDAMLQAQAQPNPVHPTQSITDAVERFGALLCRLDLLSDELEKMSCRLNGPMPTVGQKAIEQDGTTLIGCLYGHCERLTTIINRIETSYDQISRGL